MIGDVSGRKILDAGCGEGFLSRLLARGGASVTAIDFSDAMLTIAQGRTPEDLKIEYRHVSWETLDGLDDACFDIVVSVAALQDVPDLLAALQQTYRVLKPSGEFFLAFMHPVFGSEGEWVRDSDGKKLYWKIDNYFRERPAEFKLYENVQQNLVYFHRTLTTYLRAILSSGFSLEDFVEPCPSDEVLKENPGYEDDYRMSHYLILRLRKP